MTNAIATERVRTTRPGGRPLDAVFAPRSVALIGATERVGSVGRTILWNLISTSFGGVVFPVNEKRTSVLGIKAYASVRDVPEAVDLAVIVTPAPTVPAIVEECADLGIPSAIIISAGFKEIGAEGVELERRVLQAARRGQMRVVGPNCLGVMNPITGLNATFATAMARPGRVAFISQSGALCTAVLDWSLREHVGFSAFVSVGSMLDVDRGDLIDYLGNDPHTRSILMYMETIGDARSFLSAARAVALAKPIIVIKPGRTAAAASTCVTSACCSSISASHTSGSRTSAASITTASWRWWPSRKTLAAASARSWAWPAHAAAAREGSRVRDCHRRPRTTAGSWHGAAASSGGSRARRKDRAAHRRHHGREHRHAADREEARLRVAGHRETRP